MSEVVEDVVDETKRFVKSDVGKAVTLAVSPTSVAATAAVGTAVMPAIEARKARKAQEKQIAINQRRADIQNVRQIRSQLREARIARAASRASAVSRGTSGGSAEAGTLSSIQSQLAGNLNFIQQSRQLQQQSLDASREEAQARFRSQLWQQVGQVSQMFLGGQG